MKSARGPAMKRMVEAQTQLRKSGPLTWIDVGGSQSFNLVINFKVFRVLPRMSLRNYLMDTL